MCTTADCQHEQRNTCQATNLCYVQFMPPGIDTDRLPVIRGCIDELTPLLCENRPPKSYTGSWPVLHCCRENFCNQDVMPTVPSWLAAAKGELSMLLILTYHVPVFYFMFYFRIRQNRPEEPGKNSFLSLVDR